MYVEQFEGRGDRNRTPNLWGNIFEPKRETLNRKNNKNNDQNQK